MSTVASPTGWTWVWASSRSWWWAGKNGVLWSIESQRVRHYWVTELNWTEGVGYQVMLCMENEKNEQGHWKRKDLKSVKIQGEIWNNTFLRCSLYPHSCESSGYNGSRSNWGEIEKKIVIIYKMELCLTSIGREPYKMCLNHHHHGQHFHLPHHQTFLHHLVSVLI